MLKIMLILAVAAGTQIGCVTAKTVPMKTTTISTIDESGKITGTVTTTEVDVAGLNAMQAAQAQALQNGVQVAEAGFQMWQQANPKATKEEIDAKSAAKAAQQALYLDLLKNLLSGKPVTLPSNLK